MPFDHGAYQEHQQQMMAYMEQQQQQQQHFVDQASVFAVSPPACFKQPPARQGQQRQQQRQQGIARKKKVVLPAEASFGCESSFLEGSGGSSAVLASTEPSLAEDSSSLAGTLPAASQTRSQTTDMGWTGTRPRRSNGLTKTRSWAGGSNRASSSGAATQQPPSSVLSDKAPRAQDSRATTSADHRRRDYDAKVASKHRQLGGPVPASGDMQWQARPSRRERQRQFSHPVSEPHFHSVGMPTNNATCM
jgi:hypothetical protein